MYLKLAIIIIIVGLLSCSERDSEPLNLPPKINVNPEIISLKASPESPYIWEDVRISCNAKDLDGDKLSYNWSGESGSFNGEGTDVNWTAPYTPGNYEIKCVVTDTKRRNG